MTETERKDWRDYRSTGDVEVRNRLVERHLGLVHHFARGLEPRLGGAVEGEDLVSAGVVGLLDAVSAYDPGRGFRFSTFAARRIRGAMLDEARSRDAAPRSVRRKQRRLEASRARLSAELDRSPLYRELSEDLGVDLQTVWRWDWDVERSRPASLAEVGRDGRARVGGTWELRGEESVEDRLMREEEVAAMRRALEDLPERDQLIIRLYDLESKTLREIATRLGVSESRVSQLRTRALGRLRSSLEGSKRAA